MAAKEGASVRGPRGADSRIVDGGVGYQSLFLMRLTRMEGRLAVLSARGFARHFVKRLGAEFEASLRDLTVGEQTLPWARSMIADHARFKILAFAVRGDVSVC